MCYCIAAKCGVWEKDKDLNKIRSEMEEVMKNGKK